MAASAKSGITQLVIQSSLEPILESILEALSNGEKVTLHEFGTFYIKSIGERMSRNPKSGEVFKAKAKKVIKFKATPLVGINPFANFK